MKTRRSLPWHSLTSVVAAVVYGVSPIDLIPDVIPLLGWLDDALVAPLLLAWAWWQFSQWRKERRKVVRPGA